MARLLLPAQTVLITTPRGQWAVPVAMERGAAALAAPLLVRPLGLTVTVEVGGSRATVQLGGAAFVFQLGAPFARAGGAICALVGDPDIALAVGRLLRAELIRRGITASLTRQTDTLIDLADRGAFCRAQCDLFVSIHVNAMPPGRRGERVSGVETYFLSDAKTEDQERVAKMENEALRFETETPAGAPGPLGYILRDLQLNEYLRESARLAELEVAQD